MGFKRLSKITANMLFCTFFLLMLMLSSHALRSESQNYESISIIVSDGGDTVQSQNYNNLVSVGIVAGSTTSQSYTNTFGFAQTILLASGQPCTAASQCEGGFCCSSLCQSTSCPTTSPEPSGGAAAAAGGGGGGGGGAVVILPETQGKSDFSITPPSLQFPIKLGETSSKDILITNTGSTLLSFSAALAGEAQYVKLSDTSFSLEPGQQKTITAAAIGNKLGAYSGEIVVKTLTLEKAVQFLLEVESTDVLFDVKLDILSDYKQVKPGETLRMQATLINIGAGKNVDVVVTYIIKDRKGKLIHESTESFIVEQQKSYLKEVRIPENTPLGDYVAVIELRYANSFAVSSELFSVVKEIIPPYEGGQEEALSRIYYILIGISAIAIFTLYIISRIVIKKKRQQQKRF